MFIRHVMLWEFMNNKNARKIAKKISAKLSLLTTKSETGFQIFLLVIRHWQINPDQNARQTLIEML